MRSRSRLAAVCAAALLTSLAPTVARADAVHGLKFLLARDSVLATHHWYEQTVGGDVVRGGYYVRHVDKSTGTVVVDDARLDVNGQQPGPVEVPPSPGPQPRVDNGTYVSGAGTVYSPNPVVAEQNQSFRDQNNTNEAVPDSAYRQVVLSYLDSSGNLSGKYARVTGTRLAKETTRQYHYVRAGRWFEQVMAYHWVTESQRYVIEDLGFTDVNNEQQKIWWDAFPDDKSSYSHQGDTIEMGLGGVDATEDADIIWHELGHAMFRSQFAGVPTNEMDEISEGFADWWAVSMSSSVQQDTAVTPLACVADWDSVEYTSTVPHCLRRTDRNVTYPDAMTADPHTGGEIWSRALFDVFRQLGRDRSAKIVLESHFSMLPSSTFAQAAQKVVSAAHRLYGADTAAVVRTAFSARGIAV